MSDYSSTSIDHLGLVSEMCEELGISSIIDSEITQDVSQRNISIGVVMKALILNGLGFSERRLYLTSRFFSDKPIELLLGEGIQADFLNDGVIGRAMDQIYDYGTTELFSKIASNACKSLGLASDYIHLDSTSFHVDGRYNSEQSAKDQNTIWITKGYSRDHHPELNQVMLNLIVENSASIPLHMEALNGNSSDKTEFRQTIENYISNLRNTQDFKYLIADSALYSLGNIQKISALTQWISRVPETITEAKKLVESTPEAQMQPINERYKCCGFTSRYGDVDQRWLLVWSKDAFTREVKTLNTNYVKNGTKEINAFKKLSREEFTCIADAQKALNKYSKKLKNIEIQDVSFEEIPVYAKKGRPKKGEEPTGLKYKIIGFPSSCIENYTQQKNTKGRFIIASNEVDQHKLSDIQMFNAYKSQGNVERGFRFMKDPQFLASNIFVKKPERVEVVLMLMTLSLMVYAALEHRLREGLKQTDQMIPNQKGKPINNPTMRWVFALFTGIHILNIEAAGTLICLNFKDVHAKVIDVLGVNYKKYYLRE